MIKKCHLKEKTILTNILNNLHTSRRPRVHEADPRRVKPGRGQGCWVAVLDSLTSSSPSLGHHRSRCAGHLFEATASPQRGHCTVSGLAVAMGAGLAAIAVDAAARRGGPSALPATRRATKHSLEFDGVRGTHVNEALAAQRLRLRLSYCLRPD